VPVENCLDEDKALEVVSLHVNGKPQKLPEQARNLLLCYFYAKWHHCVCHLSSTSHSSVRFSFGGFSDWSSVEGVP